MDAIARPKILPATCPGTAGSLRVALLAALTLVFADRAAGALHVAPRTASPAPVAPNAIQLPASAFGLTPARLADNTSTVMELRSAIGGLPGIEPTEDVSDLAAVDTSTDAATTTSLRLDPSPALIPASPANWGVVAGMLILTPLFISRRLQRRLLA
jgi:hypothetical protein